MTDIRPRALQPPLWLRLTSNGFLVVWLVIALFPLMWITLMSLRQPIDALSANPLDVIFGKLTFDHYKAVWVTNGFWRNFLNSLIVTAGVVSVSLTVGTLAGYALARTPGALAFWLLILALIFRALPHSVLVTGYVPMFLNSRELLQPLWDAPILGGVLSWFSASAPTLYGKPWAVIAVLVAINQPFTIWMMRSFFQNIPAELDEAALVDGCTHFGAFWRVIMPVMWPGVITTGLFSFLLAYNDYLVTALLLDAQSQTMVPGISQFLNRETRAADQIEAIAAAVSITAPLFVLVMVFQKQIVSGLTAGAVKG
ncbi:MAG: carbohydrate ABC transporter permease [Methylobacteriaceae bacterium]|nr:carbohydrate ABC transporter permease [Methylobacteriaceae bacterium]